MNNDHFVKIFAYRSLFTGKQWRKKVLKKGKRHENWSASAVWIFFFQHIFIDKLLVFYLYETILINEKQNFILKINIHWVEFCCCLEEIFVQTLANYELIKRKVNDTSTLKCWMEFNNIALNCTRQSKKRSFLYVFYDNFRFFVYFATPCKELHIY